MRLDGYVRISRVGGREGDTFISPDVQRTRIAQWAALRGAQIIAWHEDLDQSGGKMQRPGLDEALERVRHGATDGIVVAKLDRFARTLIGALETIARIDEAGGQVVSVDEGIDPSTPAGKAMQRLVLVFAEWQLDVIREQWKVARQRAVQRGVHVASRVPTGYAKDEGGRLVPSPDAPVIRSVFEAKAAGASWAELARILNDAGVVGPYGAKQWTTRAMSHMLTNRVYLGEARSGEFRNPDAHPVIVDRALFEAAQNARGGPAVRSDEPALLAGLLRCAGCRHAMKPDKMTLKDGSRARIYRCRGKHASGNCESRVAVLAHVIEPWVVERVFERYGDIEATGRQDTETASLVAALEAAEAELAAYDDEQRVSIIGPERFDAGLRKRAAAVAEAEAALAEAQSRTLPGGVSFAELESTWPSLSVQQRQRFLKTVVDAIVLRGRIKGRHAPIGERALILWRGEMGDDWPRRGKRFALKPFVWPADLPGGAGVQLGKDAEEATLGG